MADAALSDLRVVDLTQGVAGPYCTKLLADYGAEVIKIEPPGGDVSRRLGPFPEDLPHPEKSGLFLHLNTNKKSVTLDVATASGVVILKKLLARADVLVESYPPGRMDRVGHRLRAASGRLPAAHLRLHHLLWADGALPGLSRQQPDRHGDEQHHVRHRRPGPGAPGDRLRAGRLLRRAPGLRGHSGRPRLPPAERSGGPARRCLTGRIGRRRRRVQCRHVCLPGGHPPALLLAPCLRLPHGHPAQPGRIRGGYPRRPGLPRAPGGAGRLTHGAPSGRPGAGPESAVPDLPGALGALA